MKVELYRDIDFDKYHTFFLEYWNEKEQYKSHVVRPCTATYEEVIDTSRTRILQLEGAVLAFSNDTTLAEILMECTIYGIQLDFIDFKVSTEESKRDRWASNTEKTVRSVDMHKEDIVKQLDSLDAPRHYVAINSDSRSALKFLVVDRFLQDHKVKFLKGKYSTKAVIAGFKVNDEATAYCKKMNNLQ